MIIEWLLDALEAAFDWVVGLMPDTSWNPVDDFMGALNALGALNYWLPIGELAAALIGVVIVAPLFLGTTLFLWLVALIRGGSSRG